MGYTTINANSNRMKYLIMLTILLCSCAPFEQQLQDSKNQLNCEPAESNGCAGWLPKG